MLLAEDGTKDFHGLRAILHSLGIVAEIEVIRDEVVQGRGVIGMLLAEDRT